MGPAVSVRLAADAAALRDNHLGRYASRTALQPEPATSRMKSAMNFLLTIVLDGLIQASWLFVVALGLTLVFGVLKILNIAHGSFYALGAYIAATAVTMVAARGLPPSVGFVAMLLS